MKYKLIVNDARDKREYNLGEPYFPPTYIIGRNSKCDISLPIKFISSIHCTLVLINKDVYHQDYQYVLVDGEVGGKGSTNGTWIQKARWNSSRRVLGTSYEGRNEEGVVNCILENGDKITFSNPALYPYVLFVEEEEVTPLEGSDKSTVPGCEFIKE